MDREYKIIKQGYKYKKHKCWKCKTIYLYTASKDGWLVYCPYCGNYNDIHLFDRKVKSDKYE